MLDLRNRYLVTAVVHFSFPRSLTDNGSTCHNIFVSVYYVHSVKSMFYERAGSFIKFLKIQSEKYNTYSMSYSQDILQTAQQPVVELRNQLNNCLLSDQRSAGDATKRPLSQHYLPLIFGSLCKLCKLFFTM
jgi:hypothetical protein